MLNKTLSRNVFSGIVSIAAIGLSSANAAVVPGSIQGDLTVQNGAATYAIPLAVPKGISGLQPELSLVYNSAAGAGIAGPGWSLSGLSVISRCGSTIAHDGRVRGVRYDAGDHFCLDGQRLIELAEHTYETEIASFSEINGYGALVGGPAYFKVRTKAGLTMTYGQSANARLNAPQANNALEPDPSTPYKWLLERVEDTSGNGYSVEYEHSTSIELVGGTAEVNDFHPRVKTITYTDNAAAGLAAHQRIVFEYATPPVGVYFSDSMAMPLPNGRIFSIAANRRLTKIGFELNGLSTNEYRLSYTESPLTNSRSSRYPEVLTSIEYCDGAGSGASCLSPKIIEWEQRSFGYSGRNVAVANNWGGSDWNRVGDFNGDGIADVASIDGSEVHLKLGKTSGFSAVTFGLEGGAASTFGAHGYTWSGDFNGDGLTDLASRSGDYVYVKFSDPFHRRFRTESWKVPGANWPGASSSPPRWGASGHSMVADFNGDGRSDFATASDGRLHVLESQGNGLNLVSFPFPSGTGLGDQDKTWAADIDGDGRSDVVTIRNNYIEVYFLPDVSGNEIVHVRNHTLGTHSGKFWLADHNGDGLPDLMVHKEGGGHDTLVVHYSRGRDGLVSGGIKYMPVNFFGADGFNWAIDVDGDRKADLVALFGNEVRVWLGRGDALSDIIKFSATVATGNRHFTWTGDFNGDGVEDIASANGGSIGLRYSRSERTALAAAFVDSADPSDAADDVRVEVDYTRPHDPDVYLVTRNSEYPNVRVTPGHDLVKQVRSADGLVGYRRNDYFYRSYTINAEGRGPAGFEFETIVDLDTGASETVRRSLEFPNIGMTLEQTNRTDDVVLGEVTNELSAIQPYGSRPIYFPYATLSTSVAFDLDGATLSRTVSSSSYDDYGNVETTQVQVTDLGTQKVKTTNTVNQYGPTDEAKRLGRLEQSTVSHSVTGRPTITRISAFTYDPITQLLESETVEPGGYGTTEYLHKRHYRDAYGSIRRTDVTGFGVDGSEITRVTTNTVTVSPQEIQTVSCSYPKEADPSAATVQICSTRVADRRHGGIVRTIDANGFEQETIYDGFGRVWRNEQVTGGRQVWSQIDRAFISDSSLPLAVTTTTTTDSTGGTSTSYLDALGRVIKKTWPAMDGRVVAEETSYTREGLVRSQSRPYFNGTVAPNRTVMRYDALARVIEVKSPSSDGSFDTVTHSYDGFIKTSTYDRDSVGQVQRVETKNAFGELIHVMEGSGIAGTLFEHDALGNVVRTTNALGEETSIEYDGSGRKTKMIDPSAGTWLYFYNSFGEVEQQTDGQNQVTTMGYDLTGRMVRRRDAGESADTVWYYDTAPDGLGKLHEIVAADGYREWHLYDGYGRPRYLKTRVPGTSGSSTTDISAGSGYVDFVTRTYYDAQGRVVKTRRPGGLWVINDFGPYGHHVATRTSFTQIDGADVFDTTHISSQLSSLISQIASLEAEAISWRAEAEVLHQEAETSEATADVFATHIDNAAKTYEGLYREMAQKMRNGQAWAEEMAAHYDGLAEQYLDDLTALLEAFRPYFATQQEYDDYVEQARAIWENNGNADRDVSEMFLAMAEDYQAQAASHQASVGYYQVNLTEVYEDTYQQYVELAQIAEASANQQYALAAQYDALVAQRDAINEQLVDSDWTYFWKAKKTDASGRITQEYLGNGLMTSRYYNQATGHLESIQTTASALADIQSLVYAYDQGDNVTQRSDFVTGSYDSFTYDSLDRLKTASLTQSGGASGLVLPALNRALTWDYDALGNITHRTDGSQTWSYAYSQGSGPSLQSVTGLGSLTYDGNGALKTDADRTFTWTSFGKPSQINSSNGTVTFKYGANRQRYWKVDEPISGDRSETVYIAGLFERTRTWASDGSLKIVHTHHVGGGGRNIGSVIMTSTNGDDVAEFKRMTYAHTDALGNVEVVTDQQGQVLKRFRYDPFGQRHDITLIDIDLGRDGTISWSDAKQALARGFTGHESIETAGIIHMNGRIYDAVLQRFLSPDPLVQSPTQTQSHNRYAYVMNNPLKYVDPTGYSWLSKTWKKVKRAVKKYWRAAVAIVITIYTGWLAAGASSFWAGVGYAAAGGFAAGMVASGGDWRAGITGALTAAAFYSVGSAFRSIAEANGGALSGGARVTKVIAHGTVGGASSAAQGGRFKDGFLSAGVTQALAPGIGKLDSSQLGFSVERTLAAAVVGGTASVVGGGKFANGAITAAFSRAYNDESHRSRFQKARDAVKGILQDSKKFSLKALSSLSTPVKTAMLVVEAADTLGLIDLPPGINKAFALMEIGQGAVFLASAGLGTLTTVGGVTVLGANAIVLSTFAGAYFVTSGVDRLTDGALSGFGADLMCGASGKC